MFRKKNDQFFKEVILSCERELFPAIKDRIPPFLDFLLYTDKNEFYSSLSCKGYLL